MCRLRLMIIVIFLIIRSSASSVKLLPDTQAYQVVPCFRTIFRPIWHVDYGGDQTLAHVFRDMHDVEAMRRAEKLPVWQLPENRPCFPYLHQRLVLLLPLSLLSWLRTIFLVFQQLFHFFAAPSLWDSSGLGFAIEQVSTFSPWIILAEPPPVRHEHGFR